MSTAWRRCTSGRSWRRSGRDLGGDTQERRLLPARAEDLDGERAAFAVGAQRDGDAGDAERAGGDGEAVAPPLVVAVLEVVAHRPRIAHAYRRDQDRRAAEESAPVGGEHVAAGEPFRVAGAVELHGVPEQPFEGGQRVRT